MPGIQRDKSDGLVRPTTVTRIGTWGKLLSDVDAQQIWDWLEDVGLRPEVLHRAIFHPGMDVEPEDRKHYLVSALRNLDRSDPTEVTRFMQVLEECLMATRISNARVNLAHALKLDGFTVDSEGNVVPPASADLFAIDLSSLSDPSALTQQLSRIHQDLYTSPELAIDAAAALVAAALKQVIALDGADPGNQKLPKLLQLARPRLTTYYNSLGLCSAGVDDLLRGLANIINGIATIRNTESPTHAGLNEKRSEIEAAELVVSAATPVVRACVAVLTRAAASH